MRKNLIVVRAGDQSLHRRWMDDTRARTFDVLVSYYGASPGRHESKADHYHVMRGPRWPAHDWLWRNRRDLFDAYERVAFVCDDVDANTATWNAMFDLSEFYGLDLAQPVIDGFVNVPITFRVPGSLLRYVNWVEVMCPVFSRRALALCGDTFRESVSGWSLGWLWCARLPYPEYKVAMVDRIYVTHTGQTRHGTLRPVLDALGVDPEVEGPAMLDRHGIVNRQRVEYARLPLG